MLRVLIVLIGISCIHIVKGQGCSDAGFCTISGLSPGNRDSLVRQFYLKPSVFYGKAFFDITVYGFAFETGFSISEKLLFDFKVTSIGQNGNGISVFGFSDLFFNCSYLFKEVSMTLGLKVPFSKADRTYDGLPLPMDYQSSLGTFDVIAGISYTIKNKLYIAFGLQHPLTQNNNMFFAEFYPMDSPLSEFPSTNGYKRSGDALFRASYKISILNRQLGISPGILALYHLANDRYIDQMGIEREIEGSKGLTLNITIYVDYPITNSQKLVINAGGPLIFRRVRPDGLTRKYIINIEFFQYLFMHRKSANTSDFSW